ncbi:MAG: polysaccharide biosynthesis tyrosine autokinase [candidate division WOR-3 bacterium]|nr:polysaccharide biosynthesis tyrosine autokinase [candidate division WOR-3 bacterium]
MLARRKWLALGVFLGVLGLSVLSIVRTKPVFEAHATMMVTAGNQSDLLAGAGAILWPRQPNTGNVVALIQSRRMAVQVAKSLPDPTMLYGAAVSARPSKDADIIQLVVSAPSRAAAVAVANAYVETYQQYDLDLSRLDVSAIRQFIENQLAVAGARLDSSERSLAEFKTAHQLMDIGAETQAVIGQQSGLAAQYQQAAIDAKVSQVELEQVQNRIEQQGKGMADSLAGSSSPLVSNLQAALNQLEVEKTNLIIRGFGANSERIQGLDRQIDSTRARLQIESQALIAQHGFADPVGDLSNLFTLRIGLDASKIRQEALAKAMSHNDAALDRLPEAERLLAGLTRDVETGRQVHSLLSGRYEEARIQEVGRVSSVRIIDLSYGAGQTKPNVRSSLSLGLLLALALAFGSVVAAEYLDTSVHGSRELERRGYSMLGSIPQLLTTGRRRRNEDVTSHLITHTDVESSGAEAFRMLRTALAFAGAERPLHTIAVTSPGPSEGKSTVSVNLASVLAQAGSRVLLIDADLRHPTLHTVFKHKKKPGLSDLIISSSSPEEAIFASGLDGLFCLPCGTIPPSPADLLTLNAFRTLLKRLAGEYDYVVIDTPPVLVAADSPIIGALVDTTIMVVRASRTALEALDHARAAMLGGGARLAGLVLNDVNRSGRYGRYYYYYYKYHYRYSKHVADAAEDGGPETEDRGPGTTDS